jgi:hypothetical protein
MPRAFEGAGFGGIFFIFFIMAAPGRQSLSPKTTPGGGGHQPGRRVF